MKLKFALLAALIAVAAGANASVTVGQDGGGNCYPFSCFASDGGSTYQQVYAASAFGSAGTFNQLTFYRSSTGLMDSASYGISFYLSNASPSSLTSTAALNRGSLLANFGSFSVSGSMPNSLSLTGSTVNYDPTLGDLLMEVSVLSLTEAHRYESFFQADYTGASTARYWANGGSTEGSFGTGALVTTFDFVPNSVPEPGSLALLSIGLLSVAMRRRRDAK